MPSPGRKADERRMASEALLEPLGSDLWFADGGIVSFNGFDYPTRMAIVRLADGGLWLWSPVKKTAAIEDEVRALGPVRHIVSPNKLHYLFLGEWQAAFPDAKLWGTAATIAKCSDLHFFGALADDPPRRLERADRPILFHQFAIPGRADLLSPRIPHGHHRRPVADLQRGVSEASLAMVDAADREAFENGRGVGLSAYRLPDQFPPPRKRAAQDIRALIDEHPEHVVVAHGEIVRSDGEFFFGALFPGCCDLNFRLRHAADLMSTDQEN